MKPALALAVVLLSACATMQPGDPPTVVPVQGDSLEHVGKAVELAFVGRSWTIESTTPGESIARLDHERYGWLRVRAAYTTERVEFYFVDGRQANQMQAEGDVVEGRYSRLLRNVIADLPRHLKSERIIRR